VLTEERSRELALTVAAGAGAGGGIPGLIDLFGRFTSAFKANTTHKESFRAVVRNGFTQFAGAFNRFLRAAERAIGEAQKGKRVLFIVDGTDKLSSEDSRRFFVADAFQLLEIEALVLYTAPLAMKYEGAVSPLLDADLVLPLIKLEDIEGRPLEQGVAAMRAMLLRRADRSLFAGEAAIERLAQASGGHPRELLRLLRLVLELANPLVDAPVVGKAIGKLAADYRRWLAAEDYALLAEEARKRGVVDTQPRAYRLLGNLALLEYNDGSWRRPHPAVKTLEGYSNADAALARRNPEA
jgi:hypothetical protein